MNEHRVCDVVELSEDAIYVWCDGCFAFANLATARLLAAQSAEALIGLPVVEFFHPDSIAIAQAGLEKLLAQGEWVAPNDLKMVRMDGRVIEVELMATPFDYRGRAAAHVMLRDVAERNTLQRVQAERDHYRQLFEAIPHLVWTARPDGSLDYVNQRKLDSLSMKHGDIEGSGWQHFVHPDDLSQVQKQWLHSVTTGERYQTEMRCRTSPTAAYRWNLSRGMPVRNDRGEILCWVGTTTDIHDQQEARAVLERSQLQLGEAVRLRNEDLLIANAALRDEIEERKTVEKALRASREKLRKLSAHLQSARESERAAVAREIHDELGATLTAAKMDLHWFAKTLAAAPSPHGDKLCEAVELIDSAIQTVKRIATELRPSILDHLGLWPALQWQLQEFELNFGIPCQIDPAPEGILLENDAQTAVFRIFQEALTNIARHARATKVNVGFHPDRKGILLRISDNGIGLPPGKLMEPEACGIQGMRERARTFGGEVRFEQSEGSGTCVLVKFPARFKVPKRIRSDREAV